MIYDERFPGVREVMLFFAIVIWWGTPLRCIRFTDFDIVFPDNDYVSISEMCFWVLNMNI